MTAEGSSVPGFRVKDFDTVCPATGLACPVQENIVKDYLGDIDNRNLCEGSYGEQAFVSLKLKEMKVAAKVIDYSGAALDQCRTRERMDDSALRKTTLHSLRTIFNKLKG